MDMQEPNGGWRVFCRSGYCDAWDEAHEGSAGPEAARAAQLGRFRRRRRAGAVRSAPTTAVVHGTVERQGDGGRAVVSPASGLASMRCARSACVSPSTSGGCTGSVGENGGGIRSICRRAPEPGAGGVAVGSREGDVTVGTDGCEGSARSAGGGGRRWARRWRGGRRGRGRARATSTRSAAAPQFAVSLLGSGRGGCHGARGRGQAPQAAYGREGSACSACGGSRRRACIGRDRRRGPRAARTTSTRSAAGLRNSSTRS